MTNSVFFRNTFLEKPSLKIFQENFSKIIPGEEHGYGDMAHVVILYFVW